MTVCVGAICSGGKAVVVAADRMITFGAPMNVQAEGAVRKILPLTDSCLLLFSGPGPDGEEVTKNTRARIQSAPHKDVRSIAAIAATTYQEHKRKRVEDTYLRPLLGVDFAGFQTLVAGSASSQVLGQLVGMIMQHNLGLDLMIAGCDDDGGHLAVVTHPGYVLPVDLVGYNAIGSGGLHAAVRLSLSHQTNGTELPETVHNVYESKVASEVAPGVGTATDIAIITAKGTRFIEDSAVFDILAEMHKERPAISREELTKLGNGLKGYEIK